MNNRSEVAAIVFPDKNNIDLNTRELWVYSATGVPTKLEGRTGMENLSFNDRGQVSVSNTDEDRAFRYTPGVGWEYLGSLSNDGFAVPRGINNSGAVVGGTAVGASNTVTPFLYRDGTGMESIPAPFGLGRAISDNFIITGDGGFVYFANEMRMEYVAGGLPSGGQRGYDVNMLGMVVGAFSPFSPGLEPGAWVWTHDDGLNYLDDDSIIDEPGWNIDLAYAINDDGWILAQGGLRDGSVAGAYLLLRPVPEPGSAALAVAFAASVCCRRRRPAQG